MFKIALFFLILLVAGQSATVYLLATGEKRRFWMRQAIAGFLLVIIGVSGGILLLLFPHWIPGLGPTSSPEWLILVFALWVVGVVTATVILLRRMR
jgi:hypothetical protein